MKKLLATAGAIAVLALTSAPAQAASPTTQATATAKIYKPLSIVFGRNLDFGVVVLNNTTFAAETVSLNPATSAVTCGGGTNMTCSGTPQSARYTLTGSNNADVTIKAPGFNLTGPATLAFTPTSAQFDIALSATGTATVDLGGSIQVAGATPEGVYTGNFLVTADYK